MTDRSTIFLFTMLPLMVLVEALVAIWLISLVGGEAMATNPFFADAFGKMMKSYPDAAGLDLVDQVKLLLTTQLNFFTLLIPTLIAVYAGAYGIVEEKVSRSLEPLLATPVRTWELLAGKAIAGFLPAIVITWICAALSLLGITILGWSYLFQYYIGPVWVLNFFLISPAIALLSFLLGIIGSSKARDHRSAQNLVIFIVFPVFLFIGLQVTGTLWFNPVNTVILGILLCLIDLLVLVIAVKLFQRESIIIRWR